MSDSGHIFKVDLIGLSLEWVWGRWEADREEARFGAQAAGEGDPGQRGERSACGPEPCKGARFGNVPSWRGPGCRPHWGVIGREMPPKPRVWVAASR